MKTWASSEESADMIRAAGEPIGFRAAGDTQVYETEPTQLPRANPYGCDIRFTPFCA